jgi:hypothetical protein
MATFEGYVEKVSRYDLLTAYSPNDATPGTRELALHISELDGEHPEFRPMYGQLLEQAYEATAADVAGAEIQSLPVRVGFARLWMLGPGLAKLALRATPPEGNVVEG